MDNKVTFEIKTSVKLNDKKDKDKKDGVKNGDNSNR